MIIDSRIGLNLRGIFVLCFLGLSAGGYSALAATDHYMGPYIEPSPEEVQADPDPVLEAECFRNVADYEHMKDWKFGPPYWFESERWGLVLRMDFWRPDGPHLPGTIDRIMCWRSKRDGQFNWVVGVSHKTSPLGADGE